MPSSEGDETYLPSDDTALLIRALSSHQGESFLEIGFGSGAVLKSVRPRFSMAVGTDIITLEQVRRSRGSVEVVLSDRVSCFRDRTFDIVAFNPPYLPSDEILDRAVDGGEAGIAVAKGFLEDALRVLRPGGRIFALLSDHGDLAGFQSHCSRLGLSVREAERVKLFYESLVVYEIREV